MKLTITTITPTLIRSGEEISTAVECVIENGTLHIVDKSKLMDLLKSKAGPKAFKELSNIIIRGGNIREFLVQNNIRINEVYKYSLKINGNIDLNRRRNVYLPITSFGKAYIPGSTLKGTIRSALLFYHFNTKGLEIDPEIYPKDKVYIGEDILRKDAKKVDTDIMKYVIIRDSTTIDFEELEVYEIQRIPHRKLSQLIIAIPNKKKISIEIIVRKDENYSGPDFWKSFFAENPEEKIWNYLKKYSQKLIDKEIKILERLRQKFSNNKDAKEIFEDFINHYNEIKNRSAERDIIFLPIGFGKTYYFNSLGYFIPENKIPIPQKLKVKDPKIYPQTRWAVKIGVKYYPIGWCGLVRNV